MTVVFRWEESGSATLIRVRNYRIRTGIMLRSRRLVVQSCFIWMEPGKQRLRMMQGSHSLQTFILMRLNGTARSRERLFLDSSTKWPCTVAHCQQARCSQFLTRESQASVFLHHSV